LKREIETEQDINELSRDWEAQPNGKPRRITRIEDLPDLDEADGAGVEWVIEGILAEGALHMITSEPGGGKSTLMAAAAYAVSKGLAFMGHATRQRPVLLLDAENPLSAIRERFARLRIKTHRDFKVWGQWVGEDPPAAGGAIVLDWVARCNPKPLIIVDSVIAFHPGAENDSNETRQYMSQYRALAAMGATVVLLHHTGKSETSKDYRGSSDYKASIDIGHKLTLYGDGTRLEMLELRPFKQRFSVAPLMRILYRDGNFSIDQSGTRKTVTEELSDLLKSHAGITKSDFEQRAVEQNLGRNRAREFLESGVKAGTVRRQTAAKNRHLHFWVEKTVE
jgi:hypothetical protein